MDENAELSNARISNTHLQHLYRSLFTMRNCNHENARGGGNFERRIRRRYPRREVMRLKCLFSLNNIIMGRQRVHSSCGQERSSAGAVGQARPQIPLDLSQCSYNTTFIFLI
jgi:hypothetical protein